MVCLFGARETVCESRLEAHTIKLFERVQRPRIWPMHASLRFRVSVNASVSVSVSVNVQGWVRLNRYETKLTGYSDLQPA